MCSSDLVQEGKDRSALAEQVRMLSELNKQLGVEASNLTKALKGSTKTQGNWGELILERVLEAARFVPLEQLCLSPQCGFSSTVHGNDIAVESQAAKLRLVIDVAREIWG